MLPGNVMHEIASLLRRQNCPVYDAEADIASLNVAFCAHQSSAGVPRIFRPTKPNYTVNQAEKLISCAHCRTAGSLALLSNVKRKTKKKLDASKVDKIVLDAHDGLPSSWLACKIECSLGLLPQTKHKVPPWFAEIFLPLVGSSLSLSKMKDSWTALVSLHEKNVPRSEYVAEFAKRFVNSEPMLGFALAVDVPSVSNKKRKDFVLKTVKGCPNLCAALKEIGVELFASGSAERSMHLKNQRWIVRDLLSSSLSHVLDSTFDNIKKLEMELKNREMDSAREKALSFDIPLDVLDGITTVDEAFDEIDMCLKDREFEVLGLEVTRSGDVVHHIYDTRSDTISSDLNSDLVGNEVYNRRYGQVLRVLTAAEMRGCFDRHAELRAALQERRLELRGDSRICNDYIMKGEYNGPDVRWKSTLKKVVSMVAEMAFLAEGDYFEILNDLKYVNRHRDRDEASEIAKLAFVHSYLVENGKRLKALPHRLVKIYEGREEEAMEAWGDVLHARACYESYDDEEEDESDYYSSSEDSFY